MNNLIDILKGCLFSGTVQQAQSMLVKYSESPIFLQQLLVLIPNQESQLLIMILSTLKNYMLSKWNPSLQSKLTRIGDDQKQIIKDNFLNLFYQIKHNDQAVNLYKEIGYMLALSSYPWPGIDQQINQDLNTNIFASVHFFRQIAKAFQYSTYQQQRQKVEYIVNNYFPRLQNLVQQCLTNFNDQTAKLLKIILKTFYSSFHIQLPQYLRNQQNFSKWFIYVKTILNAQLNNNIMNQSQSAKILSRMVSVYMNPQLDGKYFKGWSQNLRQRHAQQITSTIFNCLANPNGNQETASYILDAIMSYSKINSLKNYLNLENVNFIIYDRLLPNMQTTPADLQLFNKDPLQYIRKDQDLNSNIFIRNAADTVEHLLTYCAFNGKSQLMRFVQYTSNTLQANNVSDRHKQVLIRILTKMSSTLKKNYYIKENFQFLTNRFFIPLLQSQNPLLNSQICRLFAAYVDDMKFQEQTVQILMQLLYDKMTGKSDVLKYNSILAFTSLLKHDSALVKAKGVFKNILEIYVKMLDEFQHQNLLKCLQRIVDIFSNQIVTYAPNLISHLLSKFYQNYNNQGNQQENNGQDDGNKQSIAALSTIQQILQCPLSDQIYYKTSTDIIPMLKQIFDQLQEYFGQILSLVNVLVYKAPSISEMELVYVVCRRLLQGKNFTINMNGLNYDISSLLNKINEQSDSQYEQNLISILKNLIQKMPDNILHKYPYPLHSELLLALIQNKRLNYQQIVNLNTNFVDNIWSQYLQSYTFITTGQGDISNPQGLKSITGVSLFPWLTQYFDVNIVKILLSQIQSEQDEHNEDFYEQNTMQMLQKYADQDEQEQYDQYYGTQGVNYSFLYDSPYDSSKDRQIFLQKLKSISNQEANSLMNILSNKDKKILQGLFN